MSWTTIVLIICCSVAAFTIWKEVNRPDKSHLYLRILATLMAIASLAGILLPIKYSREVTAADNHRVVLLTPGFEADSLINYKNEQIFTSDRSVQKVYPMAKLIRLDELATQSPALSRIEVFGYGLNDAQLSQLDHLPLLFHPSLAGGGIIAATWNQKLSSAESFTVQGRYNNNSSKAVSLILFGLSTRLDSAIIPAKSNKEFDLRAIPKSQGRLVYHLAAIAGTDTLENEDLPVQICPVQPLKILMLSASPDFETRFLKNWLSENGFAIAIRSAISKDKFSSEYVNMQPVKVDHLNAGVLDPFDLVIGDLSVLKSESELKRQVMQNGLGVIVRADTLSKGPSWLQADFPVEKLGVKNPGPVALSIRSKEEQCAPLQTGQNFVRNKPGTQPLVNDVQGHVFVSLSIAGAGKLAFTTINITYNWVLAGHKSDYSAFWALLIGKTARKTALSENWTAGQFPTVNEPVDLLLQSSQAPEKIMADSTIIAPAQNPSLPFEWKATYWPSRAGWHSVKQHSGQPAWWYVYGDKAWRLVKASEKLAVTSQYAKTYSPAMSVTKQIHEKVQFDVPKIYFYLLLLGACVLLWVEQKLKN